MYVLYVCMCMHMCVCLYEYHCVILIPYSYFRMYHYGCLATGTGNGYIEVVQKAETIANIQKTLSGSGPKLTWDNRLLHAWLKEKNPDPQQ